jgi:hypothetical protein
MAKVEEGEKREESLNNSVPVIGHDINLTRNHTTSDGSESVGGAMIKSPKIFYCPFGFFSLGIPRYILR